MLVSGRIDELADRFRPVRVLRLGLVEPNLRLEGLLGSQPLARGVRAVAGDARVRLDLNSDFDGGDREATERRPPA